MKYLLFLVMLPFTAACQISNDTNKRFTRSAILGWSNIAIHQEPKLDTVRAALLLTRKKMTYCHNYEGYAVMRYGEAIYFLDDRKKRFKTEVTVWQYRLITSNRNLIY